MSSINKKHVLLLTYYFPPAGMGNAQRIAKLCKYWPMDSDWYPTIMCGEIPSHIISSTDDKLFDEIPPKFRVIRVKSFFSSKFIDILKRWKLYWAISLFRRIFVFPDPYGDWIKQVVKTVEKEFPNANSFNCILASGPPKSTYVAGLRLAKKWKIPLVIDMRDPWERSAVVLPIVSNLNRIRTHHFETAVYDSANYIVANTQGNANDLIENNPALSSKITVIPNGFDYEDLDPETGPDLCNKQKDSGIVNFLYLGGIRGNVGGRVFEEDFYMAVSDYLKENPKEKNHLKIHFLGCTEQEIAQQLLSWGIENVSKIHGVVATNEVGRPLHQADAYVLILPPNKGNDRGWIPSKLYYYLAGNRPILAIIHKGSAYDLIKKSNVPATFATPGNRYEAVTAFSKIIELIRSQKYSGVVGANNISSQFDRRIIAKKLVSVLEETQS